MAVKIKHDGEAAGEPAERCCFCRKPTRYWFESPRTKDVACCRECAKHAEPKDFPTKKQWCRREEIANPRLVRRF